MKSEINYSELEKQLRERTEALEMELADRIKAEEKLIKTLDKLQKKRLAILNLMEDLKLEIEERKKTEKQLEEERNLFLTIIDNIPDPINLKDSEGRYILNNRAHLNLIGVSSREEAIGKTTFDFFSENDALIFQSKEQNVLLSGEIIDNEEYIFHKNSNDWHWHLTSKIPIPDDNGKLTRVLTISHDITERKCLEEKIKESEIFFRTLFEISPDAIAIFDTEGNLKSASRKAIQLFNVPDEKLALGTYILDWVDSSFHEQVLETFAQMISGNLETETKEYLLKRFDGTTFWGEISSGALTDPSDKLTAIITICRDVTERKKLYEQLVIEKERAEESNRLKTAFLRNISHEIRTPANAINGFSALLREPDLDQETLKSYIDAIIEGSNQLITIIGLIIEMSNIEAGLIKLTRNEFSVNSLLKKLYSEFLRKAEEKGLSFCYTTSFADEDAIIFEDENKIERVLQSLLNNAIKFTSKGHIEFGCRMSDDGIDFFVSDTGIGIPEHEQNKIFKRFYQVDGSLSRHYEGLGLGLSISQAYIELMGGEIIVDSTPGKGSIFYVRLPAKIKKFPK